MTLLQYKDYQGAVSFEDNTLVIQILHIDDSITTTCDSAAKAQRAFEDLVDDYLETCALVGKEPSKPFKGTFNVRVGSDLHRKAVLAASDIGQTLNAWVSGAIRQRLERQQMIKTVRDSFCSSWSDMKTRAAGHLPINRSLFAMERGHSPTIPSPEEDVDAAKAKARQIAVSSMEEQRWSFQQPPRLN